MRRPSSACQKASGVNASVSSWPRVTFRCRTPPHGRASRRCNWITATWSRRSSVGRRRMRWTMSRPMTSTGSWRGWRKTARNGKSASVRLVRLAGRRPLPPVRRDRPDVASARQGVGHSGNPRPARPHPSHHSRGRPQRAARLGSRHRTRRGARPVTCLRTCAPGAHLLLPRVRNQWLICCAPPPPPRRGGGVLRKLGCCRRGGRLCAPLAHRVPNGGGLDLDGPGRAE